MQVKGVSENNHTMGMRYFMIYIDIHIFLWKTFYDIYPHIYTHSWRAFPCYISTYIYTFFLKALSCYISTYIYTFFERHFYAIYSHFLKGTFMLPIHIYTHFLKGIFMLPIHIYTHFWKAFLCYLGARYLPWCSKFKCQSKKTTQTCSHIHVIHAFLHPRQ